MQHFYIDFRHAFFQASYQIMIDYFDLESRKQSYKRFESDNASLLQNDKDHKTIKFYEGEI